MSHPFLFGNGNSQQQSKYLAEFKAGKMTMNSSTVTPIKRKGLVYLHQSDNNLMPFCWKDRQTGVTEDDLILFPDDADSKNDGSVHEYPQTPRTDKNFIMNRYLNEIKSVSDQHDDFGDKSPINFNMDTPRFESDADHADTRRNPDHPTHREIAQMIIHEIIKFC